MRNYQFNRKLEPISQEEWIKLTGDRRYREVVKSYVKDVLVSTVWLGLNYNFSDDGKPLIFETMVFKTNDEGKVEDWGDVENYTERHHSEEEALNYHLKIVGEIANEN